MKLSGAQSRAVELLAGEEGWVRRGTIQAKTMDVLVRLDLVEAKRDDAIHVTVYRATQNARDWVRGQQEDALSEIEERQAACREGNQDGFIPDRHSHEVIMALWDAGRIVSGGRTAPGKLGWFSVRMIEADHAEALAMDASGTA